MNQTLAIDTVFTFPSSCQPTGAVSGLALGITGVPLYQWTGPGPGGFIDASVWQTLPSGWYYLSVTDNVCQVFDSAFVDILNPPIADFTVIPNNGCSPLDVAVINNSLNGTTYNWNFGNGQTQSVTNTNSLTTTYTNSTATQYTIQLIVLQGLLCSDTAFATVILDICGCNDPAALNYNVNATVNDGSCTYPIPPSPEVHAPNVFTPNGDLNNDEFFLTWKNLSSLQLTILNRWGNVLYDGMSSDLLQSIPTWDGSSNGKEASDGIYTYKYVAVGLSGEELIGHGFLHLVRH